ncbi:hypothetical protein ACKKBG_A06325 [Auxenochlorella protothecoides x Auxenochlorella symbiontica]
MEEQAEKYRTQKSNNNLLLVASARGYLADVEALIERGAELDCRDRAKLTPLHYAAGRGRLDIVRALKARGVDLDPESPDGRTPLHLAALRGHAAVAGFLAGSGAWVGAFDGSDSTPLHLAARHGHEAAAQALLSHGADPGLTNKFGLRPVDEAAVGGHAVLAAVLQRAGGGAPGSSTRPLLQYAAGLGNLAAVRMLLGDGADVNGTANDGTTALHAATLAADADCVALLLESGAAASAADAKGRTAADLAEEQDRQAAARAKEEAERPPLVRPGDAPNPPPLSRAALARVRALLADAGAQRQRRPAAASGSSDEQAAALGPREAFLALAPGDRLRKVERWASLPPDDLDAALAGFEAGVQAEVQSRLEALRTTAAHLNIHKAITALHEDEEFQADAARPEVRAGIEAIRKDTSLYDSYARDPVMLSVLQKLRRVHAVSSANKQRTVDLDLLLNTPGEPRQPPDAVLLARMEAVRAAHLAAAAAAVVAPAKAAQAQARAMYDAVLAGAAEAASGEASVDGATTGESLVGQMAGTPKEAGADTSLPDEGAGAGPEAAAAPSARRRVHFAEGSKPPASDPGPSTSGGEAPSRPARLARTGGDDGSEVPDWLRDGFSWPKVWAELWRQCQLALLILAVFLVTSSVLRGKLPWAAREAGPGDRDALDLAGLLLGQGRGEL